MNKSDIVLAPMEVLQSCTEGQFKKVNLFLYVNIQNNVKFYERRKDSGDIK